MNRFWSQTIKNITPYVPGEQPKDRQYIKLNTNENPYPPSPKALDAIRRATDETLRLYPDPDGKELRNDIAHRFDLKKNNVYIGNGSDELLAFCFPAFFEPTGQPVLFADITYSFYPVYAAFFQIPYQLIPVDDEFNIPLEGYFQDNGGIIVANPNAPSGKGVALEDIEVILQHNESHVVILDEAYVDFGGRTAAGLIDRYPNLLVIRTLSKSHALAGLRVGFILGNEELIEGIIRVKDSINSYTVDRLAQAGALQALQDDAYFQETRRKIINTRERISEELKKMGCRVIPSEANFIFISHPHRPGRELFLRLREKGILVRYFDKPKIDNFLRVSIGTDEEMDCFLAALNEIGQ
ncbi:MAG TPA: histidinol-phosphate transaminase [Smithellaceae bacterium]|nr:histidinol-phosphate transaminase [Smithellaceae bacterium]HQM45928.1 histidinol-phosphate transaminase [Smithellaceae bacterium]